MSEPKRSDALRVQVCAALHADERISRMRGLLEEAIPTKPRLLLLEELLTQTFLAGRSDALHELEAASRTFEAQRAELEARRAELATQLEANDALIEKVRRFGLRLEERERTCYAHEQALDLVATLTAIVCDGWERGRW